MIRLDMEGSFTQQIRLNVPLITNLGKVGMMLHVWKTRVAHLEIKAVSVSPLDNVIQQFTVSNEKFKVEGSLC